jgi:hypothetical protein
MSDFKETCIWMSYRYAIGRKSIASVSHARDIANHLDWIPDDRKEFTGKDMMREINDKLNSLILRRLNLTAMLCQWYRKQR